MMFGLLTARVKIIVKLDYCGLTWLSGSMPIFERQLTVPCTAQMMGCCWGCARGLWKSLWGIGGLVSSCNCCLVKWGWKPKGWRRSDTWGNWNYDEKVSGIKALFLKGHIDGLAQDCSYSIANALELLQSCTKPLLYNLDGPVFELSQVLLHLVLTVWRSFLCADDAHHKKPHSPSLPCWQG